jgi:hypothetical protein
MSRLQRLHLQITRNSRSTAGRSRGVTETLTPAQIRLRKEAEAQEEAARRAGRFLLQRFLQAQFSDLVQD